jgi:hypothetical protein
MILLRLWRQTSNEGHGLSRVADRRSLHSATPDFLLSLVALAIFMRLSFPKAAHVAMSSAAWQEIWVRSVEKHFQEGSAELQIPRLRSG